jgi:hypothetical protein
MCVKGQVGQSGSERCGNVESAREQSKEDMGRPERGIHSFVGLSAARISKQWSLGTNSTCS